MQVTGANLIANQASQNGNKTFTSINPYNKTKGEITFYDATEAEVNQAVEAASEAFKITRNYPASKLADFLDTVADEIEAIGDLLLETADQETGLGASPRLAGERGRTTNQLRAFGRLIREGSFVEAIIDTAQPNRQPAPRVDIRRMLFPIGPVAVFPPNNFPLAFGVAGGDTASAFASGCPVILKGHPSHPATSELVAHAINNAIQKHDFPVGFFSLLQGAEIAVGQALVNHPDLQAVAFTGSLRGGRAIFDSASKRPRPIPVYAEMGSINPVILLPDAIAQNNDTLVDGLVGSITLGSGQFCTNPGIVFVVDNEDSKTFIDTVTQKMTAKQPTVLLNGSTESGLVKNVAQTSNQPNVKTLTGGYAVEDNGFCYANTVLQTDSTSFRDNPKLQEEHFGPVTLFVTCESLDDIQNTLDIIEGNLTATIHATDDEIETAQQLFDVLREKSGRLLLNGFPTGVEVVHAMQHGGPYPATTTSQTTSVGMAAIKRYLRPVAYQNMPDHILPPALQNSNPLNIWRTIDNEITRDSIEG